MYYFENTINHSNTIYFKKITKKIKLSPNKIQKDYFEINYCLMKNTNKAQFKPNEKAQMVEHMLAKKISRSHKFESRSGSYNVAYCSKP